MSAWKRHRFALAIIVLLVAVFFAPSLATRKVFTFRDHSDYFQPLRYYTAIHLKSFQIPWWNPYSQSGEPWLANPQTGVFYPPAWLFAVLPFETAYMSYLALHLALLGAGAYLLFARQVRPGAAMVGAVAVMFSGPVMSLMDVQNNLTTFAWVPLVIWCGVARVRPQVVAVVLAMAFLAGEPFFAAMAALFYVIVTLAVAPRLEAVSNIAVAGAGAFGLSAIQALPFLEMLRGSDRAAGLRPAEIFAESMRLRDWIRLAVHPRFTSADQPFDPTLSQHFIPVVYVGLLVVFLAMAGVALLFRRQESARAASIGWLLLLAGSVVIAAGNRLPATGDILTQLPVTVFRYPSRLVAFAALAIAALAAAGWNRVRPDRRWVDLILVLMIVGDLARHETPLFRTDVFVPDRSSYSPAIGRTAKMARVVTGRLTNRTAFIAGYLNLYQRRFDAGTAAPVVRQAYWQLYETAIVHARSDLLNFLGIGFIFSDRPLPTLPPVARSGPVTVYANRDALPVATFWSSVRAHQTGGEALEALLAGPQNAVLDIAPPAGQFVEGVRPFITSAAWVSVDSRHARVRIDAPVDGVVMITQQDDPAWQVTVDGKNGKKILAGGVFRAVAVSKGHHEVVWEYRSRSFSSGLTMTIITVVALVMSRFVKRSAAKKFSS